NELANRLPAEIHEGHRLGEKNGLGERIDPIRRRPNLRDQRIGRRRFELDLRPSRQFVQHVEPDVVPRAPISRSRIAKAENRLQLTSSSLLSLPWLPLPPS